MKQIPLSRGKFAFVDDEDFEWLSKHKWAALKRRNNRFYAVSKIGGKSVSMHRIILGLTDSNIFADHKDNDGLNNQRHNLRPATKEQNQYNRGVNANNPTKRKGVNRHRAKFQVRIRHLGEKIYLGLFEDADEAARAYDAAARKYHGEFANLNFPDEQPASL